MLEKKNTSRWGRCHSPVCTCEVRTVAHCIKARLYTARKQREREGSVRGRKVIIE